MASTGSPGKTGPISVWPGTSSTVITATTPVADLTADKSIERILACATVD